MSERSRRRFLGALGVGVVAAQGTAAPAEESGLDPAFGVRPGELTLRLDRGDAERRLSFHAFRGAPAEWRGACRAKLAELIGFSSAQAGPARRLRSAEQDGIALEAWVMEVDASLTIPAYLLTPSRITRSAVIAIHGHGRPEPAIGFGDDYHHRFALELARDGHLVLCPTLRGFSSLGDMAAGDPGSTLDYWVSERGKQFTLVTDALVHGRTLIGETVEDLLRWEGWLARSRGVTSVDVAGISYGGDLAFMYPVFSERVHRIYSSGSLGSFSGVFSRCYNAPAHVVPGILRWMDRSDIAGLNAPRRQRFHYGELDTPGPRNNSASYNETVQSSLDELRAIYRAFDAEGRVSVRVTAGSGHEMDVPDLKAYLA